LKELRRLLPAKARIFAEPIWSALLLLCAESISGGHPGAVVLQEPRQYWTLDC